MKRITYLFSKGAKEQIYVLSELFHNKYMFDGNEDNS